MLSSKLYVLINRLMYNTILMILSHERVEQVSYTLPVGTELNLGRNEDSDSVRVVKPITVFVVGPRERGALPVKILEGNQLGDDVYYWHQSESILV